MKTQDPDAGAKTCQLREAGKASADLPTVLTSQKESIFIPLHTFIPKKVLTQKP